jgi:urease accessory protein
MMKLRLALVLLLSVFAQAAGAHVGMHGGANGFAAGLAHPFMGIDHVLAVFTLGLWSAQTSRRALSAIPIAFLAAMALGATLAIHGVALPAIETGIAASVLVVGLLVAFAIRAPLGAGLAIATSFALFHGHAHGNELPAMVEPIAYVLGFLAATTMLLATGVVAGRLIGARPTRAVGACVAVAGAALLAAV